MNLDIHMKLDKDFVHCFNELKLKFGEKFEYLNGLHQSQLNQTDFIDNFVDSKVVADATIDSNANARSKDISSLRAEKEKSIDKLLAFNKIFYELKKKYGLEEAQDWLTMEWNGTLYLHDASSATYIPYCYAYDLQTLVDRGLWFIETGKSKPAKHFSTFADHTLEFVSWTSNRTSGACGLPSFLVHAFYYWKHDVETGYYMKSPEWYRDQVFQKVIYDLNQPYLRISQSAFTNFSIFDRNYLIELFGGRVYPDGTCVMDYIDEIIEFQKSFMRVIAEIRKDTMYTFPVLTYSLLYKDGKFVDEEFARWCSDHNTEWNDSNFFVSDNVGVLSNCCRLLSSTLNLDAFINSIGGTALSIGSIKVNTINLRRLSLLSEQNEDLFIGMLDTVLNTCINTLDIVRIIINRNVEKGLLPIYQEGLIDMDKQYSTIGVTAVEEVMKDFGYIDVDEFGYHTYSDKAMKFTKRIFDYINNKKEETGFNYKFNVEAIPAERANVVLAEKDSILFPDSEYYPIYSNQWIALTDKTSIQEKIRLGSNLDKMVGGGTIAHINLDHPLQSKEVAWNLLNKIASEGVIYFAFNVKISVCEEGHGFFGETCPVCNKPKVDTWQRIVGYISPAKSYSKQRKIEFDKRDWFEVDKI